MEIPQDKIEQAKGIIAESVRRPRPVSYGELYLAIGLDHTHPRDRQIGSHILGAISRESNALQGVMLSAVVCGAHENEPAEGFYKLAVELGRLPLGASGDEKYAFWVSEYQRCYELYGE